MSVGSASETRIEESCPDTRPRFLNLVGLNDPYKCMCTINIHNNHSIAHCPSTMLLFRTKKKDTSPLSHVFFAEQKARSIEKNIF